MIDDIFDISQEHLSISVENMLYPMYYKEFGIRRNGQLMNPVFHDLTNAQLPKNSVYHYNPESPKLLGPLENNPWYKNDTHLRFINHTWEFKQPVIGGILKVPSNIQNLALAYRRKHRTIRLLRDWFGINKQPNTVMIENYCILNHLFKYRPHALVNYHKFHNLYNTILAKIDATCDKTERQQFFEIRLPTKIESKSVYRQQAKLFEKGYSRRLLQTFPDDDSLLLFHFWMWIGRQRQYSLFNNFKLKNLDKINLIFTDNGKFSIINLGMMNKWRITTGDVVDYEIDNDDEFDEDLDANSDSSGDTPELMQAKFYRYLLLFTALRNGSTPTKTVIAPTYTEQELNDTTPVEDDDDVTETAPVVTPQDDQKKGKTIGEVIGKATDLVTGNNEPKTQTTTDVNNYDKGVQKDTQPIRSKLPQLPGQPVVEPDELPTAKVDTKPIDNDELDEDDVDISYTPTKIENPTTDYALRDAKELVEAGMISAKEYQKFKEKTETYKTLPNPFEDTSETIESYMKVDPQVVNHIEKTTIPDNPWMLDKSMLESTTENFTKQYVTKVLNRNVTQSVMVLQKAGVAVTNIERDLKQDPANKYQILKMKIQPLGGKESTINIKLPYFEEDGTFLVSGNKYHLKNQRADLVIRKVSENKVSLTTYYGKLFLLKSDRLKYSLGHYIRQQFQALILSDNSPISNAQYGNVSTPDIKVPALYGEIATRFNHLEYTRGDKHWYCHFDYKTRRKEFNELSPDEKLYNGVQFGVVTKTPLQAFIRYNNTIVVVDTSKQQIVEETQLDTFFGFEKTQPLEMVEFRNMGKSVPIGIVLGYYIGLTPLCRLLGITPRKVYRGQRSNLQSYEYQIKFADETWIFDRRNYKAQLILSGFTHYARYLEDYSVQQYEEKDVYSTILRDAGLSGYFEEELNLLERLFIDDISRDLLLSMGEPTEFVPLLVRGVELLTDLTTRAEINMEDMIIRGHQRIAGHVYTQMIKAIKDNRNKNGLSKGRFEFKENSVFRAIQEDASVALVDDINPIHSLKEKELVTFGGEGGRTARTLVGKTRSYDATDLGTISESTVDNSNVASTVYLSSNPNLVSLYGQTKRADLKNDLRPASLLSTSAMLGVGSTTDD